MAHGGRKPFVVAVVFNSVTHDARVLKEASALRAAGHPVTILGVANTRDSAARERLADGVKVVRMRMHVVRQLANSLAQLVLLALLLLDGLLIAFPEWILTQPTVIGGLALLLVLASTPLVVFLRGWPRRVALASIVFVLTYLATLTMMPAGTPRTVFAARAAFAFVFVLLAGAITVAFCDVMRAARTFRASLGDGEEARPVVDLWAPPIWQEIEALLRQFLSDLMHTSLTLGHLSHLQPDIVHCHDLPTLPAGVIHALRCGVPVVYDSHEVFEEQSSLVARPLLQSYFRAVQRLCSGRVTKFVTINESIATYLHTAYRRLPPAVIVRNATVWHGSIPTDDGRLRKAAGLGDRDRILLYQGGFSAHRGLQALVQSARRLPESWYVVLMGWGALEDELRALASSLGQAASLVRFLPGVPQAELAAWTAGATVGVIPYPDTGLNHRYCTPNKLWEYPAAGVPILATPLPELRRTIDENGIGWLLPSTAPTGDEIAGALTAISPESLEQARRACRRFVERENWDLYAQRLVEAYDDFAANDRAAVVTR